MRWAIGDIQGCWQSFAALLERIAFRPGRDELWLAGDLVNRGTGSLEVLRFCAAHAGDVRAVLGNHDVHLLARAAGVATAGKRDTLTPVLTAPDRDGLLAWLGSQPLLRQAPGLLMVHGGLPPQWSVATALQRAREAEDALAGPRRRMVLRAVRGALPTPAPDSDVAADLETDLRAAATIALFTRLRSCDAEGVPSRFSGRYDDIPPGNRAWFDWRAESPSGLAEGLRVVCGHWAALGLRREPVGLLALDTGCVWGNALTAVDLDTDTMVQQPTIAGDLAEATV